MRRVTDEPGGSVEDSRDYDLFTSTSNYLPDRQSRFPEAGIRGILDSAPNKSLYTG
jgi:hypothetical protein